MSTKRRLNRKIKKFLTRLFPGEPFERISNVLWCCSIFPFTDDWSLILRQVKEAHSEGGGTVEGAIEWAEFELDKAMVEVRSATSGQPRDASAREGT